MSADAVIHRLQEKNYILTSEAVKYILDSMNPEALENNVLTHFKGNVFITPKELKIQTPKSTAPQPITLQPTTPQPTAPQPTTPQPTALEPTTPQVIIEGTRFKPLAKEYPKQIKVKKSLEQTKSISTGTVQDFTDYFLNRYEQLSAFLKTRGKSTHLPISEARKRQYQECKIIGMVTEKKTTKNGHKLIHVEDPSASALVFIGKDNEALGKMMDHIILDEVIAIEGKQSKDLFIANSIFQPDMPQRDVKTIEDDIAIAMLSDIHIGSKLFMGQQFEHFIKTLRGEIGTEKQQQLLGKVKYITICGDAVDGVGVYPTQETELAITDIYEQYDKLHSYIEMLPDYIHVVIVPGNHDTVVKVADPQPRIPEKAMPKTYKMSNVTLTSSPAILDIHGVNTLLYHGFAFDDVIADLPSASYAKSESPMTEMLKRRHLHPRYGGKPITPEKHDHLVISESPDLFHGGHLHNNGYANYKGTLVVNSGTWQSITEFQAKMGHKPTPCILPIFEAKHGRVNAMHFDRKDYYEYERVL
ncbi:MAG: DNA-directed DNA polymerase II small subunit [DPANN group archaeon]|nr:DNA-directed DNA polymerase II small subunit [DPANN group archaeon]